jgi:hypothetical protein
VPRHGGLRKRPCDFCGGKGFKVPKKTLAKLTGRRFICAAPPNQFPRAHWEPSNEHLAIMSGETVVGTLMQQTGGTLGDGWFWSITAC